MAFKHVLVTGGLGFIGSHIVKDLLRKQVKVSVIDKTLDTSRLTEFLDSSLLTIVHEDLLTPASLGDLCKQVDGVFHLAAYTSVHESMENPSKYLTNNIGGTQAVLEAARANNLKFVVFSSSCSVYGDKTVMPISETDELAPLSPYAYGKMISEQLCEMYRRVYQLPTVVLRYFNVFGPGQDNSSDYSGVVSKFRDRIENNQPITIYGDGKQSRDFIYVQNVVNANISVAESIETLQDHVFNVGLGASISVLDLYEKLSKKMGITVPIDYLPARKGDIKESKANNERLQRVLPKQAFIDFEAGLDQWIDGGK